MTIIILLLLLLLVVILSLTYLGLSSFRSTTFTLTGTTSVRSEPLSMETLHTSVGVLSWSNIFKCLISPVVRLRLRNSPQTPPSTNLNERRSFLEVLNTSRGFGDKKFSSKETSNLLSSTPSSSFLLSRMFMLTMVVNRGIPQSEQDTEILFDPDGMSFSSLVVTNLNSDL